jgi:signal transduction histidine kinase
MAAMDALIGEVLALARGRSPEALAPEPVDLSDLARELLAERELVLAKRQAAVTSDLAPAPVVGDRRLLARAMGNLLDNALKYTPEGDLVRLETALDGGEAAFRVVDQGPGIPASDLPHLFEPFYRPDRRHRARARDRQGDRRGPWRPGPPELGRGPGHHRHAAPAGREVSGYLARWV